MTQEKLNQLTQLLFEAGLPGSDIKEILYKIQHPMMSHHFDSAKPFSVLPLSIEEKPWAKKEKSNEHST